MSKALFKTVKDRKAAYMRTFNTEAGKLVLRDLAGTCFYDRSAFDPNPFYNAYREGMRNVYLKIIHVLDMEIEENPDNAG